MAMHLLASLVLLYIKFTGAAKTCTSHGFGQCDLDKLPLIRYNFADEMIVLSYKPRILYFPNFIRHHETIDYLERLAIDQMEKSILEGSRHNSYIRNSKTHFLTCEEMRDPVVRSLQNLTSRHALVPLDHFEALQFQKYESTTSTGVQSFYRPHMDSLPGTDRRVATLIYYLSDVESGGATIFPLVPKEGTARDFITTSEVAKAKASARWDEACSEDSPWLQVKPKKGSAVLFYSLKPDGTLDYLTMHGGCPVHRGTKLIAQQWLRENSMYEPLAGLHAQAFWYRISQKFSGKRIPAGCAIRPQQQHELVPVDVRPEARHFWLGLQPWCTHYNVNPILAHFGQSRALTLSFILEEADCSKKNNFKIQLRAKGDRCCNYELVMSKCELTLTGPQRKIKGTRGPKVTRVEASKIEVHDDSDKTLVTVIVSNRAANMSPSEVSANPHTFQFTNYVVKDGGSQGGNDESGEVSVKGVQWRQSRMCVAVGKDTVISNLRLITAQVTANELNHIKRARIEPGGKPFMSTIIEEG